jgi:hypothetical protein
VTDNDGTQELPESSRNALIRMANAMREGFTGEFRVVVNEGGVRALEESRKYSSEDLRDEPD